MRIKTRTIQVMVEDEEFAELMRKKKELKMSLSALGRCAFKLGIPRLEELTKTQRLLVQELR